LDFEFGRFFPVTGQISLVYRYRCAAVLSHLSVKKTLNVRSMCSAEMVDVARRSSLDAATVFFFKETQVKSMAWIRTKDIIYKKQRATLLKD